VATLRMSLAHSASQPRTTARKKHEAIFGGMMSLVAASRLTEVVKVF
jgi:hypothetical protein